MVFAFVVVCFCRWFLLRGLQVVYASLLIIVMAMKDDDGMDGVSTVGL